MLLSVVLAVLNGLADDLRSRILQTESHVRIVESNRNNHASVSGLDSVLAGLVQVQAAGRFVRGELLLLHRGRTAGAILYGTEFDSPIRQHELSKMITSGQDGVGADQSGLVLGSLLAQRLWVAPGDTVLLATPEELMPRPGRPPPKLIEKRVSSVFSSGLPDYDASLAFLPVGDAAALLHGQGVRGIELWLRDPDRSRDIARQIRSAIGPSSSLRVQEWLELNRNLFDALRLEKVAMFVVLALAILIAALNITGGILRNVMERRAEIAILLTLGCVARTVLLVFVVEGIIIGVVGAGVGSVLGFTVCRIIEWSGILAVPGDFLPFPTLPLVVRTADFFYITLAAIAITTVSATYPAYRASRLDPVAILRSL
jgi:lipoprotein-releasing system permease protein